MSDEVKVNDYGTIHLRMTVDVTIFAEDSPSALRLAKEVVREGDGDFGVGEQLARKFMQSIIDGRIEIDDIRDVEDHTQ